ncbi:MAG: transglutaminase family protein [Ectothiorhodospiraceae bacterium]|nr:transglutaminase family protein [Ectothiorhodospiraceae bacterium]
MWLEVRCSLSIKCQVNTPLILLLRPRSGAHQWVGRESYLMYPQPITSEYTDSFGNLCQRLIAPAGGFRVETMAQVHVAPAMDAMPGAPFVPVEHLPDFALMYLSPSRFCESDRLASLAWEVVGNSAPGYDQVSAISRWIHNNIRYLPESDPMPISAMTVAERREGVCRDFAHLGIALCRSLTIPARIVVGYLEGLEPMDLHAWVEAYVGGRWYSFDPTPAEPNRCTVSLAYGRDATDVPVFNPFGPPVSSDMRISVERIRPPSEDGV